MKIKDLLETTVKSKASDLHLLFGYPPILRIDGNLVNVGEAKLTEEQTKEIVFSLFSPQQKDLFLVNKEIDFSYQFAKKGRFRINTYSNFFF